MAVVVVVMVVCGGGGGGVGVVPGSEARGSAPTGASRGRAQPAPQEQHGSGRSDAHRAHPAACESGPGARTDTERKTHVADGNPKRLKGLDKILDWEILESIFSLLGTTH